MMKKNDKSTFPKISGVFGTSEHVHCQRVFRKKPSFVFK